jgi:hypothetical protein
MALNRSVMNVAIATVADELGATVSGVQGAITTAYTLVMAALMITGGKELIGRTRAFAIGSVI